MTVFGPIQLWPERDSECIDTAGCVDTNSLEQNVLNKFLVEAEAVMVVVQNTFHDFELSLRSAKVQDNAHKLSALSKKTGADSSISADSAEEALDCMELCARGLLLARKWSTLNGLLLLLKLQSEAQPEVGVRVRVGVVVQVLVEEEKGRKMNNHRNMRPI